MELITLKCTSHIPTTNSAPSGDAADVVSSRLQAHASPANHTTDLLCCWKTSAVMLLMEPQWLKQFMTFITYRQTISLSLKLIFYYSYLLFSLTDNWFCFSFSQTGIFPSLKNYSCYSDSVGQIQSESCTKWCI